MKKIFTLSLSLLLSLSAAAQATDTSVQFSDKDGNIIADGTTLTINHFEEDPFFGDILMPSGLFLKNTTSSSVRVSAEYTISTLSSGKFQICFPQNCVTQNRIGTYASEQGDIVAGALRDMQTEWLPTETGTCNVSMKIVTYKQNAITKAWVKKGDGPSVQLNFAYDPASISGVVANKSISSVQYFTLDGRRIASPKKGVFVVKTKYADGSEKQTKQLF